MKVSLIQCPAWQTESPPYALAIISALLESEKHTPTCFDMNIDFYRESEKQNTDISSKTWNWKEIETDWQNKSLVSTFFKKNHKIINKYANKIIENSDKIIGFSVHYTSSIFSILLAELLKKKAPDHLIIFGGPYCFETGEGENIFKKTTAVDYIFLREAEQSICEFVTAIEKKQPTNKIPGIIKNGQQTTNKTLPPANPAKIPFADYTQFDLNKYTTNILPIITSRGCINRCTFCNEGLSWGKYSFRKPQIIYKEIIYQKTKHPRFNQIWFTDSLMNGNIYALKELCMLLIGNNINISWVSEFIIRKEMTKELLDLMKKSGCFHLTYGLESGSNKILKAMNKRYNKKLAKKVIKDTFNTDIKIHVNIIVGFPGETTKNFIETLFFMIKIKKYLSSINISTCNITKGSLLYNNREKYNIISDENGYWKTEDNKNNISIRQYRQKTLRKLANQKSEIKITQFIKELYIIASFIIDITINKKNTQVVWSDLKNTL